MGESVTVTPNPAPALGLPASPSAGEGNSVRHTVWGKGDNMTNGSSLERDDKLSILGKIVGLSLLPAVYLYFAGFVYVYYYFRHFSLSLQNAETPAYYFIVYSFSVFVAHKGIALLIVILLGFAIFLVYRKLALGAALLVAILIVLFPAIYGLSRQTGTERAELLRNGIGAKRIQVVIDEVATKALPPEFLQANVSGDLIFLSETDDYLNVLLQKYPDEPDLPRASVFKVPKDKVLLAKITIGEIKRAKL
jgi:hypothetical protein